jgi:2-keto-4-pentenoate hydratase/2-oxohepta-3-ene-1,7-dioic acid hydratase in catechol pathway
VRYVQYNDGEKIRPGIIIDGQIVDLQGLISSLELSEDEFTSLRTFIEAGEPLWEVVQTSVTQTTMDNIKKHVFDPDGSHTILEAPLKNTHKLILLAGNYRGHIDEVGFKVPGENDTVTPQFFMKPPSTTVIGPGQPILIPHGGLWIDWEVELAVVIGRRGKFIPKSKAMEHVFGYTILNDVSERVFNSNIENRFVREKDPFMDWLHGKWFDTFAPMGPFVVTPDEIQNPHNLEIKLFRNGEIEQSGNTSQMIHSVSYLIHKLSEIITLEPGDVIATGTPSGVGHGKGIRLEDGDTLKCVIESIGSLSNPVQVEQI